VVRSADGPDSTMDRGGLFARACSSTLVTRCRAGHINADSGFGEWPEGKALLTELVEGR
jgi:predicted alpha/beta hydrolase family esterase